jgi:hypothetical protein
MGSTVLLDTTVMTNWVGASNGTLVHDPIVTRVTVHVSTVVSRRRARVVTRGNISTKS